MGRGRYLRQRMLLVVIVWVVLPYAAYPSSAQTDPIAPISTRFTGQVTSDQAVNLYAGPGDTYEIVGTLDTAVEVTVLERNRLGNWLHISVEGAAPLDGWALSGYFSAGDLLPLADIPVNTALTDADLNRVADPQLWQLYALPVIPTISRSMRAVYLRGRRLGNHSNVFTKIGDSITADPLYLLPINWGDEQMGPYAYLEPTIRFFGPRTDQSVAAKVGFNTYAVFDPFWADPASCAPNESPLDCEYRHRSPSIAFIMFGPNDLLHFSREEFNTQMRLIVEDALARGIIPVLSTFSYSPELETWPQAIDFNLTIAQIADDYDVPLINLWLAARPLPDYGLEGDFIHMEHWGLRYISYERGEEAFYGGALRNLLSIRVLDDLRRTLRMDARPGDAIVGRMGSREDAFPSR